MKRSPGPWFLAWIVVALTMNGAFVDGQAQPSSDTSNPLLAKWSTPFGVPPFDRIRNTHYLPAIKEAIARQKAEVAAIANNPQPATFANTIEALDASGQLLAAVSGVFESVNSAETNDELQDIARQVAPLQAGLQDDILLSEPLFTRVKEIWMQRESSRFSPEQRRLIEETHKKFVRGGAHLTPDQKKRFRGINEELSVLGLRFGENVLKETNAYRLVIEKKEDLSGLSENIVTAASEAAKIAGMEGKWVFTLQSPSIWPFLSYSSIRDLRREILTAYTMRGDNGNAHDNKSTLLRIVDLRGERARLLGYPTHADFVLAERMVKAPDRVYALLGQIWTPALAVAKKEAADLRTLIAQEGQSFKLEPWDWRYYTEKIRKARFDLDENETRQYFTLENARQGAFSVANKLWGVRFVERTDLPRYHSEVRIFEVKDSDGSHLGVYLVDYHPRPGKNGGAWCGDMRGQHFRDGKDIRPIVTNVCNFTRSSGTTPALLRLEEVKTLFHEFGHAMHSLLSRVHYRTLGGVPTDFVELPSTIMENWALEPEVLKTYARHWKTGETIPDDLITKIRNADTFNQGFLTVEYLAASYLDMDWHTVTAAKDIHASTFENASLEKIGLIPEILVRYRSPYFRHIFSGDYSAGYYSYIWSDVLASDAFKAFTEKGIFDPATARSFRTKILEKGGTSEAMEMFKNFRGREPSVEPLLERRGLAHK